MLVMKIIAQLFVKSNFLLLWCQLMSLTNDTFVL